MVEITVTQEEWNNQDEIDCDIHGWAYAITELDWEGHSTFTEDNPEIGKYVFFVKNELIPKDGTDGVVAAWENDDSMVVGVKVVIV